MSKPDNSKALNQIKLLFIARTYPPLVGGMEQFALDFHNYLKDFTELQILANPTGKKGLLLFTVKVFFYLIFHAKNFDIIHFNDAILSPLIPIIRIFSSAKISFTVHGLDIVYKKFGYQHIVIPFLRKADRVFPVSQYTKEQCISRGIPEEKLVVIPNGLNFAETQSVNNGIKEKLLQNIEIDLRNKVVLLSIGRLITRKGHCWFIENVFINLPDEYVYFIAGTGPEYDRIKELVTSLSLENRVKLFGYVSDEEKACLFQISDLFIMPNITDENDQEGFGIVLLEAGSYSLPSIAANIEGIKDAVIHGVTGILVGEKDAQGYIDAITNPNIDRKNIVRELRKKYDWKIISKNYLDEFSNMLS